MWQWLDDLRNAIEGTRQHNRRLLHRKFHLSGPVVAWLQNPARTSEQQLAFVELVLKLDSDPAAHSQPVLRSDAPPGMRWAPFAANKAIFVWDIPKNEIRMLLCV